MGAARPTPPGWPSDVPPPDVPDWQDRAVGWLLDHCPADYRGYDAWRRHPVALSWITVRHLDGQIDVMREAYRRARVDLGDELPPEAMPAVLEAIEREGLRMRAAARAARLVHEAMLGKRWVPRL